MATKNVRTVAYLPPKLRKALDKAVKEEKKSDPDASRSLLIVRALERYLDERAAKKDREK